MGNNIIDVQVLDCFVVCIGLFSHTFIYLRNTYVTATFVNFVHFTHFIKKVHTFDDIVQGYIMSRIKVR